MSLIPFIPVILRTSRRDIRITRSKFPAPGFSPIVKAARFAQTLLRRYLERGWFEPYTALVFRNTRIGACVHYRNQYLQTQSNTNKHIHLQTHLHTNQQTYLQMQVIPKLSLTVLTWGTPPNRPVESIQTLPAPQLHLNPETQALKTLVMKNGSKPLEQLADQIIVQKKRLELLEDATMAPSPAVLTPATRRVFRNVAPPSADQLEITRVVEQKVAEKFHEGKSNPLLQEKPQAPIDINTLADQVIRQIDHRIIAQRERLGKV